MTSLRPVVRSTEPAPATNAKALADQILAAGRKARGTDDVPLPEDATARAIVLAGMKARGEIVEAA